MSKGASTTWQRSISLEQPGDPMVAELGLLGWSREVPLLRISISLEGDLTSNFDGLSIREVRLESGVRRNLEPHGWRIALGRPGDTWAGSWAENWKCNWDKRGLGSSGALGNIS